MIDKPVPSMIYLKTKTISHTTLRSDIEISQAAARKEQTRNYRKQLVGRWVGEMQKRRMEF